MSSSIGYLKFIDGQERYCIYYHSGSVLCPKLFNSIPEANKIFHEHDLWYDSSDEELSEAEEDEQGAYVYAWTDAKEEEYLFATLASPTKNLAGL